MSDNLPPENAPLEPTAEAPLESPEAPLVENMAAPAESVQALPDNQEQQPPKNKKKQPKKNKPSSPPTPEHLLAQEIARQLGETKAIPFFQIRDIIQRCGADFAKEMLQRTFETEANGGLMLSDGSRRRTLGGVFFYLAMNTMTPELRYLIIGDKMRRNERAKTKERERITHENDAFEWAERAKFVEKLSEEAGTTSSMRAILFGRPDKVIPKLTCTVLEITYKSDLAQVPQGVPKPKDIETRYTVYVGSKQWTKAEPALKNPEEVLIIQGICLYDPTINGMAFYAQSVSTKEMEAAKREKLKETAEKQRAQAAES